MAEAEDQDRILVRFPKPLSQEERRFAFHAAFEATFEDCIDEIAWNDTFTELRLRANGPISELSDEDLADFARRMELTVPTAEGGISVRREP